jgi:hypothetical protein
VHEIDVLIPFFRDNDRRQWIWDHNRGIWDALPTVRVLVGEDPCVGAEGRPFSPARARNAASRAGTGEWVLAYDSDVIPPTAAVMDDTMSRAAGFGWSAVFSGTRVVKVVATDGFIAGETDDPAELRLMTRIPSAIGPTLIRRELFDRIHGYDERFEGWGFEDTALRRVLTVVAGQPDRPPRGQDCWALSPYTPDLIARHVGSIPNRDIYEREYSSLTTATLPELMVRRSNANRVVVV